ncbi:MAG TPA: hypothetical protein VFC26_05130 [Verrucomicrobiae bacterium]|nr:hypothetical protein [Verrucomicrobiae bacterium]
MQVIRPNCRAQFSAEDIDFIVQTLGNKRRDCLIDLLKDEHSRDVILDDELLFRAVLERPECLRISMYLYFYILVRNVFRGSGLGDREVSDYVAAVLAEFSQTHRTQLRTKTGQTDYFVDMLAALQTADDITSFFIRAHMGNYSLFLSGVFPDRIRMRSERRGAPDIRYYEEIGRSSFRAASDHRLAYKYDVAEIFNTLSERFQTTRKALNDLGDRLISLDPPTKIGM